MPKMTPAQYQLIASVFADALQDAAASHESGISGAHHTARTIRALAENMADTLAEDDATFDHQAFRKAAGLED